MRTSASQFEIMVSFMERYGDLSRPSDGPNGRVSNIQRWGELAALLNADATGDSKTEEKWRKTCSDLKNNIKRKAAKINRSISGTGGGPATNVRLTEIEERVLAILNPQAVTGMIEVEEIGLEQEVIPASGAITDATQDNNEYQLESWNVAGSSSMSIFPSPSPARGPSPAPARASEPSPPPEPASQSQPTTPRQRRRRLIQNQRSPRRRRPAATLTQAELARQSFLNSDREWLTFNIEKERNQYNLDTERLRLRETELQQQERWQQLYAQFLVVLEKICDKFTRDPRNE